MSLSIKSILLFLWIASFSEQQYFIPTSDAVRVATMAAHDEGIIVGRPGVYLDELRTKEGKEPLSGYTSIGLYKGGQLVRSYAIRVNTGDVVDPTHCYIFRFTDLKRYKINLLKSVHGSVVSDEVIASEIGCDQLIVIPSHGHGISEH